ncbi:hypothetical protein E2C01_018636 [Portunus trituberculatus]|uniref:Uncharacterized protein n=1 Tax=Portunus trituberculatus TaxID=210409 RepID=A0A5B7DWR0_PORTR|nr:hypothetical protein [Portunus trituberculatus]
MLLPLPQEREGSLTAAQPSPGQGSLECMWRCDSRLYRAAARWRCADRTFAAANRGRLTNQHSPAQPPCALQPSCVEIKHAYRSVAEFDIASRALPTNCLAAEEKTGSAASLNHDSVTRTLMQA